MESKGMGLDILTIVFLVLKLCGVITWSWWWVFSPIWISWGSNTCDSTSSNLLWIQRNWWRKL